MQEVCFHCGLDCEKETIYFDKKAFCCNGCKSVYEILNSDSLKAYYELNKTPGIKPSSSQSHEFDFLENVEIQDKLLLFKDENVAIIRFKIPVIHCTSCVWVLENLHTIKPEIESSKVHFTQKTVQIHFKVQEISLKEVAEFLTRLGYKPVINLEQEEEENNEVFDKNLIIKLGIAGFCFGNTMLFAFPEYFTQFSDVWFEKYKILFRYLMVFLSLPVVFYCANSYYKSAITGIRHKIINIDIPISIGISVLFLRSLYEAFMDLSSGYFDSLSGLVFFMLIGKYFQQNTYKSLSFDRNYKSFYPLSITKITSDGPISSLLSKLKIGDRILVRNGEMIPADSILIKGTALIDNSFITGEIEPVKHIQGDKIFAGGKQRGEAIELEIVKAIDHSYLTTLWQNAGKGERHAYFSTLIEKVSKYFTIVVLFIAFIGGVVWYFIDVSKMFQVVTAVLIVACPCALALSTPFTLGNVMRILGMHQIFTKDITTLEKLNTIQNIVLDKTGTLTETEGAEVMYFGEELTQEDENVILSAFQNSTHPLSRKLVHYLRNFSQPITLSSFEEIEGKGIATQFNNEIYKLGSKHFTQAPIEDNKTSVCIQKNGQYIGRFLFSHIYRKGIENIIDLLENKTFSILSGDNESERKRLQRLLGENMEMKFHQTPENKLDYIKNLQERGKKVMMIGDGINDAAALKQSDVGVAITDDVNTFTPASDIIMKGNRLALLPAVFQLSEKGVQLVKLSMLISFLYNIIGLSFALAGMLSPLVAAILMPISSISVVIFASVSTWYFGNQYFRNS